MALPGGFFDADSNVQGLASPAKSKAAMQSLRPVTIKQLLEAHVKGDSHTLSTPERDVELGQVTFQCNIYHKGCICWMCSQSS
jgi:hypothetical protein